MKILPLYLLLATTVLCAPPGLRAAPNPAIAPQDRALTQTCVGFLAAYDIEFDTPQRMHHAERMINARERAARRILSHIPPAELHRRLSPYLTHCKPGTSSYVAMAYTLGYFEVKPAQNLHRLRECFDVKRLGNGLSDTMTIRMDQICRRFPSKADIQEYLLAKCDASIQEELVSLQHQFFLQHPQACLTAASSSQPVHTQLAYTVYCACVGEDQAERPIHICLRRWHHSLEAQRLRQDIQKIAATHGSPVHL